MTKFATGSKLSNKIKVVKPTYRSMLIINPTPVELSLGTCSNCIVVLMNFTLTRVKTKKSSLLKITALNNKNPHLIQLSEQNSLYPHKVDQNSVN